jgi:hypothetical protein
LIVGSVGNCPNCPPETACGSPESVNIHKVSFSSLVKVLLMSD